MKLMLFFLAIIGVCSAQTQVDNALLGSFIGTEEVNTSVQKEISVKCAKTENGYEISILVVWEPGVEIEIDENSIKEEKGSLDFTFTDNFGNKGRATFKMSQGNTTLNLEATEVNEPRAARQYGSYFLRKK